jgi:hypothetical protein
MITNKNKINYLKYGLLLFLLIGVILSINNLLNIHEHFIGGERSGTVIVNNYDFSGSVNDTERNIVLDNNFMNKNKNNKDNETFYNLKRNLAKID